MNVTATALTLTCALGAVLTSGATQAAPLTEGYCEQQLEYCLMISFVPEPCYQEYERCVSGGQIGDTLSHRAVGRHFAERRSA